MLLYSLLKNFAICGNKAIPIHESDRVRFLNAKPYPIATKPTEMNAIEALTQHIEEQTSKIDWIMLKLTSITNALDQLQLSQQYNKVQCTTAQPGRCRLVQERQPQWT